MAAKSIYKALFYTTAGIAGFSDRVETELGPSCVRRHAQSGGDAASRSSTVDYEDELVSEWIERLNVKQFEVPFISGGNNQTMDTRSRGNHGVL
jgi:hypothetical protein